MANVSLALNFQMTNNSALEIDDPTPSNGSTSGFTFSDKSGHSVTLTGSGFVYEPSGDWIGGAANSAVWTYNGQQILSITGASVLASNTAYDTGYGGELPGMQSELAFWLRDNDVINGSSGNEYLKGYGGNDTLTGGSGNDIINGGTGIDTATYLGARANYAIQKTTTGYTIAGGTDGTDTLINVERLQFTDKTLAFDLNGNAGQVYRLYQAAFNRTPDSGGLGDWIYGMDHGMSLLDVSAGFIGSNEFKTVYGQNPTDSEVVTRFYENVLHRAPEQAGYDYWMNQIQSNLQTRTQVLTGFSESPENQAQVIGVIQNGIEYTPHQV